MADELNVRGKRIEVLDHGFVELVDYMGDDLRPAAAARVSYGREGRGWNKGDGSLTRYLLDNHHTSPFEQVEVVFNVKVPIFVARQWIRHRTANVNEFSMRYADPEVIAQGEGIDFYKPEVWRGKSASNKQGSEGQVDDQSEADLAWTHANSVAETEYVALQQLGVANELARIVLPVSAYTQYWWKNDLHNTLHFFDLRADSHAQWEIQQYANAMMDLLRHAFPRLMDLYIANKRVEAAVALIKQRARIDSGSTSGLPASVDTYMRFVRELVDAYKSVERTVNA